VHTDDSFDNLSAPVSAGRNESRIGAQYQLDEKHVIKGEAIRTQDSRQRDGDTVNLSGAQVAVERILSDTLRAEIGSRFVQGTLQTGTATESVDSLTLRGRLTTVLPGLPMASVYGDYEQDVRDATKRALAVGGDYRLSGGSRLYARHEVISSLGSMYEFNRSQRTFRTLAGIDSEYMKDGRVFSEYRMGGALGGRDGQAALGLRNGWEVSEGLRLNTTFERTKSMSGKSNGSGESTALTGAVEYLANSRWKGSTSLELRRATQEDSVLGTLGIAFRLNPDWTFLGKSAVYRTRGRGNHALADSLRLRQRFGAAYRQSARNALNALAYYEHRFESGRTAMASTDRRSVHIVSSHVNTQPLKRTTVSGRYAAKHVSETGYGFSSAAIAQLISARLTHDIGERWDAGVTSSVMMDNARQRRYAFGVEVGYRIKDDLWVSLGHNIVGFTDPEFSDMAQTTQGVYLRLRYKFDENSFL
jgi:hypothetical protein